ncbi:hypothetical protein QBC38DRAFT_523468 [Podospora fimiseda]|uniref:Uncharacterized protein n=1 Tax=Podospora fimiseda TaxID=252190 RepID=A0AAN7BSF3_9PEZI|nr:hypothetical protein QBC38DRAFT_523468 [Podospora fimiseda]
MDVATGIWRDYTLPGWYASMITVNVRSAALIISGLTIFITLVSGRFWAIVVFAIHQLRTADSKKDGLHYQHQLAYRNSSTYLDTIWNLIRISWAWRRRAPFNFLRTILFLLPPVICFAGFTAASLFSTRVTTPSYLANRVRVVPRNCGYLNWNSPESYVMNGNLSADGARVYGKWFSATVVNSRNYARSCYTDQIVDSPSCNVLPVQQFPYNTSETEPCPFDEKRCLLGPDKSFGMTTPWLDSHKHFGINSPPSQRVSIRRSAVCSVLKVDDLTVLAPYSEESRTWYYFLGTVGRNSASNPTYQVVESTTNANIPFKVISFTAVAFDPNTYPGWLPILDFNRTDADVSLFVLNQNSMIHGSPTDDPFFAAHRKQGPIAGYNNDQVFYTADNITTFMACAEQFQLLNNVNNVTTALSSMVAVTAQRMNIGLSDMQAEIAWRLLSPTYVSLMGRGMYVGQGDVLRASQSAYFTLMSGKLPSNQWQIELKGWFDEALAMHQLESMAFASKSMDGMSPYAQVLQSKESSITNKLCKTQIMRNTGKYQTFSVLGLALIVSLGMFISILSWTLEWMVTSVRAKKGKGVEYYKNVAWRMDSMFHQQRLAFEAGEKKVKWDRLGSDIPVTTAGATLERVETVQSSSQRSDEYVEWLDQRGHWNSK